MEADGWVGAGVGVKLKMRGWRGGSGGEVGGGGGTGGGQRRCRLKE